MNCNNESSISGVYFIRDRLHHSIKIGVSKRPLERLRGFQTGSLTPLEPLVFLITHSLDAYSVECELHHIFKQYRISGEWFFSEPVEKYLTEEIITIDIYSYNGCDKSLIDAPQYPFELCTQLNDDFIYLRPTGNSLSKVKDRWLKVGV